MATMRPQHVLFLITISSYLSLLSAGTVKCVPRSSLYAIQLPKVVSIAPLNPFNVFCKQTTYPIVCQAAIDAGLLQNSGNDLPPVTKANILFAINKLKYNINAAKKFIVSPTTSPSMVALLRGSCLGMYKSMIHEYHVALSNVDFATKETYVDAALTDIGTCIDSYTDPMLAAVIQISLLASEDEELRRTATNIVDLKNGLKL